jgi:type IV pilus assembly protein PilE
MDPMREGNAERGFTLIEIMIVVAIVGVLAMVVVPSFLKSGSKSKARTEVAAMFSEIASKQEQFKAETSRYIGGSTTAPYTGTSTCPASVPTADYNFNTSCMASAGVWLTLRLVPPQSAMRCQYTITADAAGTSMTIPTGFKNSQGGTTAETVATSWWQVLATCRGSGAGTAQYYQSSVDRKIQAYLEKNL